MVDDVIANRERTGATVVDPEALDIATVILTFNEAIHIERAIANARQISRDVIVIDSFSTDGTVELATRAGARVLQNQFTNHAVQFNWGLLNAGIDAAWTLRLDADELLGDDLIARIRRELPALPADVTGVIFNRRHLFMGRWIRHGGRYPLLLLRLWRTGQGEVENRWMDEHVILRSGRAVRMDGAFSDANENDLTFFTAKHNGYATREAVEVLNGRYRLFEKGGSLTSENSGWQARAKRWTKERIYNRFPLGVGPLVYFLQRYTVGLGFLDGKEGLIYHFLQGFWYRFLVDAKVMELDRRIAGCRDNAERRRVLAAATGLRIDAEPA
jgi:glycosyltransferase involved in cell wall biosynthesis